MTNLKLKPLTIEETKDVYANKMKRDFAVDELIPVKNIVQLMEGGEYESYGLFDGKKMVGYVGTRKIGTDYLVDYIATEPENRNRGLGGELLKLMAKHFKGATSIFGEVEDPDFAEDEATRELQQRRVGFYNRNGIRYTGVKVTTFGVHFLVYEVPLEKTHTADEMRKMYRDFYMHFLPYEMYVKNIVIEE